MSCNCNGTMVIGWTAPDGDYDFEPCECAVESADKQVSGDTRKIDGQ